MWIFDAHLDIAMNARYFGRDQRLPLEELRAKEGSAHPEAGTPTVTLAELAEGNIPLIIATLIALPHEVATKRFDAGYRTRQEAEEHALDQLALYNQLHEEGVIRFIRSAADLEAHLADNEGRVGLILSMEGADPVLSPDDLLQWWERGLRLIGPAWYGEGRYVFGTATPGPFKKEGPGLLRAMQQTGMILDCAHLAEQAFFHAMDQYDGPMIASHANCRAFVPGDRQLSDEMIKALIAHDGVVGAVCDAWMLSAGWKKGDANNQVTLATVANHIDHVCQLAGNADHAGIGSDLDGGFGTEQSPSDLNRISDLHKLLVILRERGFQEADVKKIAHGNWLRVIKCAWK